MCDKEMGSRRGKIVCSITCRVEKKHAFDYFSAVLSNLKKMTNYTTERCIEGIREDEIKRKRPIRIFDAWVAKINPNSNERGAGRRRHTREELMAKYELRSKK
jgi:hypothetical protein